MPITITVPQPGAFIGPGSVFTWTSDFIGPLPTGSFWRVQIDDSNEFIHPRTSVGILTDVTNGAWQVDESAPHPATTDVTRGYTAGSTVFIGVELLEPHSPSPIVLDSGTQSTTWQPIGDLKQAVTDIVQNESPSGGLTPTEAAQLTDIQTTVTDTNTGLQIPITDSTGTNNKTLAELFAHTTLDQFVTGEVTAGETFDPVRATVGAFWYSIVVQVTTISADLVATTPDATWHFPDLATLRILRGTDVEFRAGCHLPDQEFVNPLNQLALLASPSFLFGIPLDFTLAVDWRFGCGGRVFLKTLP